MAKSTAIKIISGIAVVAVVVVVALAIAGVFTPNSDSGSPFVAQAEESSEIQVVRGLATDTVFYIKASEVIGDINSYVSIKGNDEYIELSKIAVDEDEFIYGVTAKDGFISGLAYEITLNGAVFTDEAYEGLSSLIFTIAAEEAEVMALKDSSVVLAYEEVDIDDSSYENNGEINLTIFGAADEAYLADTVFIIGDIVNGVAYKAIRDSQNDGDDELVYVEEADVDEVFADVNIHKSYELDEEDITFDEEVTVDSIMNSDFVLDAYALLFGTKIVDTENVKLGFDVGFSDSKINLDIELKFVNFIPGDADWEIVLSIDNDIAADPTLNFQKDPKAFDFSVDMDITTKAEIDFKVGYNYQYASTVDALIDQLKVLTGANVDKGTTFFTWAIPVGPLPICITYQMGIALSFDFVGQLGFDVTNEFSTAFGIVYANSETTSFSNYDNKFEVGDVALSGKAGAKFGITNAIGISAYGVVAVDLGVEVGIYADIAGRISFNVGDIIDEKQFNLVPAYYLETGIYLDLDLSAKVFTFDIAKFNLLSKKWPLYDLGYKYIPIEFATESETIYLSGTYGYISTFDADSFNLLAMSDAGVVAIPYDQFNYDLSAAPNITLNGNKIEVKPTVTGKFEDTIVITSKCNDELSKTLIVKKMAEAPSTEADTIVYDKNAGGSATFEVLTNTSKFVGLSGDVSINDSEYAYAGSELTISESYMNKLGYGTYGFVFESSKGNLELNVQVISTEPIVAVNNSVDFDMASPSNALFEIDLKGNSITNINGVLPSYYTYQVANSSLAIYGSYLKMLGAGAKSFTVNFSNGTSTTLTVNIVDNRLPKLTTTSFEFDTSSNRSVEVPMTLYSADFQKVSLNGSQLSITQYQNNGTSLVFTATYLKSIGEGVKNFVITTDKGDLSFSINVSDSIVAVIPVKYAIFDKAAPSTVSFTVYTSGTANLTLSGNDVEYTYDDGFVIDSAYLQGLDLGIYDFAVGGANAATLTVEIINTKEPSIVAGDYSFNKADPEDVAIGINLEAAEITCIDGLEQGDYGYADGELTIYAAALSALPYGTADLRINTNVNSFDVAIDIMDSRVPVLLSAGTVLFDKTEGNSLTIDVELYDKEFVSVSGSDIRATSYRYNDGVLTISNEYAYGLADGNYQLTVNTSNGTLDVNVGVTGTDDLTLTTIGAGTVNNPYKIFTKAQMEEFADDYSNAYYELNADIDWGYATIAPIGSKSDAFNGVFDGNGYTIKNITIEGVAEEYTGFFAYNNGTIKNVTFADAKIVFADHGSVGAGVVAGMNNGIISNVKVSGSINAESKSWLDLQNAYFDIGGVAGYNAGTISNADVTVQIDASVKGLSVLGIKIAGKKSNINVGAIAGYLANTSNITSSVSDGNIVATATSNNISFNGWYGERSDGATDDSEVRYFGTSTIG